MKSRMFVVDSDSLLSTQESMIVSIRIPIKDDIYVGGKEWVKTTADIMADLLQVHIGDYIFLWETKTGTQKSRIHGVYRAISNPYFHFENLDDIAPFKIHIDKAYDFRNPIDEYDVLNHPYLKANLWTIIGKKVAGKSRGTSPLSLEDSKSLIMLLMGKNQNQLSFIPFNDNQIVNIQNPLKVDYTKRGNNPKKIEKNNYKLEDINFFDNNGKPYYEKVLETVFNQEMRNRNSNFFNQLGIDVNKVIWYSNYLPYSIEKSEMDYVVFESEDGFAYSKIFVIDFINKKIDIDHIHRTLMYSKWINDTVGLGISIAQPIIICSESIDFNNQNSEDFDCLNNAAQEDEQQYKCEKLKVYVFDFSGTTPNFTEKR